MKWKALFIVLAIGALGACSGMQGAQGPSADAGAVSDRPNLTWGQDFCAFEESYERKTTNNKLADSYYQKIYKSCMDEYGHITQ